MSGETRGPAAPAGPSRYVQALALGIDPAWRRLDDATRRADAAVFVEVDACAAEHGVSSTAYSMVGLEPGVELLLFRVGPDIDALETAASRLLLAGLGRWASVRHSFLGRMGPSQYVATPTEQEQGLIDGERSRYLVVYPFTKSTDWYLLGREARQGIMNEHMRVGRGFPQVRQLLAYGFGLDDHDFLVAYETDDLAAFGDLVRALRGTESRRSTVRDTPILTAIHRPLPEAVTLIGG
ncbi:MAG TPA: chlorite dismutase family protein [Candidatus Limnocylindrales bacterium]|nr:chlorite dismutase family protein [Candidatus Limnocylindrales bacterium]